MEFKGKNDYSITIYNQYGYIGYMVYVNNLHQCARWLDRSGKYNTWTHINVYARRTRRFIAQYSRFGFFPATPR